MTLKTEQAVPKKLSEAIRMAIKDGRALDPELYKPHWMYYHLGNSDLGDGDLEEKCHVCLAGAVIAGTLGAAPEDSHTIVEQTSEWKLVLYALDYVRTGAYYAAWREITGDSDEDVAYTLGTLPDYLMPEDELFVGVEAFTRHLDRLESLADRLGREGL